MTKPTFNPAEPMVFEYTPEDVLALKQALHEWSELTDKFENSYEDNYGNFIKWSTNDFEYQYLEERVNGYGVFTCEWWSSGKWGFPVTYTPPEAIKVIMSGEEFVIDGDSTPYYFYPEGETIDYIDYSPYRVKSEGNLLKFIKTHPNWHTAKLVEEKKPRVFKDWEELCQWYSQFAPDDKSKMNTYDFELKVFNEKYSTIYEIDSDCKLYGLYRDELIMAFNLGATVELVEG